MTNFIIMQIMLIFVTLRLQIHMIIFIVSTVALLAIIYAFLI
jgi:hypothetical protein